MYKYIVLILTRVYDMIEFFFSEISGTYVYLSLLTFEQCFLDILFMFGLPP